MTDEPVQVEVLDRDGRPVLPAKPEEKKHALTTPLNFLLFLCAMVAAFGILLVVIGQALQERARELGHKEDEKK